MQNYFVHFYTGRVSIYQSMYIQYLVYYFILVKSFCSGFDKALWTKPWRNYFEFFEIMVSNDSLDPETLYQHV